MKQSLQLKLGQQLTMTPQLQQAIRLLQLSTIDLQQEIQEALGSNPLLEVAEEDEPGASPEWEAAADQSDPFASASDDGSADRKKVEAAEAHNGSIASSLRQKEEEAARSESESLDDSAAAAAAAVAAKTATTMCRRTMVMTMA
jgi:RNA polymerase sigma-54 factor